MALLSLKWDKYIISCLVRKYTTFSFISCQLMQSSSYTLTRNTGNKKSNTIASSAFYNDRQFKQKISISTYVYVYLGQEMPNWTVGLEILHACYTTWC